MTGHILDEAEYLTNLVNALLVASQLQYGHLNLQKSAVRGDELANKVVERFRTAKPGFLWVVQFPEDFPAIQADAERLREVLQNLISNATKYSPRGSTPVQAGSRAT